MDILTMDRQALLDQKARLEADYATLKAKGLKLDMSRGKPGDDQLALCRDMLTVLSTDADLLDGKTDTRNYGGLEGIMSCRKLFGELLDIPAENILAGGNSSLTMMYDTLLRLYTFGAPGGQPWSRESGLKWLCPAPGYDRHFAITQQLGFEMIPVTMLDTGPDMAEVERLIQDPAVKGIWCVPKHSNPQGICYSDDTVRRFAALKPAAPDFRIFWDNAYCVHDLCEPPVSLLNLFDECRKAGSLDSLLLFASTSKITYPGAGVSMMACSDTNLKWTTGIMTVQAIGPDKVNQLRHVRYFKDAAGVRAHMAKHAAILGPKFQAVLDCLSRHLTGTGAGTWLEPKGGYFISFDSYPGCAQRINTLCKEAGVVMTGAGATYPLGLDPLDSNLRIAPSLPPLNELEAAMEVFCVCALLAATEKRLSEI